MNPAQARSRVRETLRKAIADWEKDAPAYLSTKVPVQRLSRALSADEQNGWLGQFWPAVHASTEPLGTALSTLYTLGEKAIQLDGTVYEVFYKFLTTEMSFHVIDIVDPQESFRL